MFAFFDVFVSTSKSPSSNSVYKIPCKNYLRWDFRWLQITRHVIRINKFCWRSNPKSPGLLFWVFYTLEEQSSQQMVPWTRIEFQLPHLKNFKLKQRSASFGIQRNFKLNKDSQTDFFSLWWVLSLIQKNLRPVQIFVSSVPSEKS